MPVPSVAVAVVALAGGAAVGVGLEQAGVLSPLDEPVTAPVRADQVAVLDCPEGVRVATLSRGDRIVAIGRSDDGAWIEIRSPIDLDAGAWLPTPAVVPDGDRDLLDDLPDAECDRTVLSTTTSSTSSTTTSTTTSTTSTTTTVPVTTATTAASTTTAPPDSSPPVLRGPVASQSQIVETSIVSPNTCPSPAFPRTSALSVTAADDQSDVAVTMSYDGGAGGPSGSLQVTRDGSTFAATLGPFTDSLFQFGGQTIITVAVQAQDRAGNVSTGETKVTLFECGDPP